MGKKNVKIKNICIIGMGFIGTTLAAVLAEAGFLVFGVEKDKEKLKKLKKGNPHFREKGLKEMLLNKNLAFFSEIPADKKIDAFIISVGTPINKKTKLPELNCIKSAAKEIALKAKNGQLIILRSTVPVGCSRNIVLPILKQSSRSVYLSFCPERAAEGKAITELKELPQIISGLNQESLELSEQIFSKITPLIIKASSLKTAEMIKLIDNSWRDLRFAFANQIASAAKDFGLDGQEVITLANKDYERNNIALPGFVGGICLEKDPHILNYSCNYKCSLAKASREVNTSLINNVFERISNYLKNKILVCGLAFKGRPETDDLRGSPAVALIEFLKKAGAEEIWGHDFAVEKEDIKKLGIIPCSLEEGFSGAKAVVFMNNHENYQNIDIIGLIKKGQKDIFIFDGWNMFCNKLKNTSINYESIGFRK